jgi:hypothetical protein
MHSAIGLELQDQAVKITWCSCELCSAVGPRSMTLVRNHHEYKLELSSQCCKPAVDDELLSADARYFGAPRSLRNQIRG